MQETIPLGKITTTRKMKLTRKQLIDLANHMARNGLQVPLLVDADYQLIDGLCRLKAAETLGVPDITVTVAHTYDEAIEALTEAHDPEAPLLQPLTTDRIWEISESIRPLMRARIQHAKGPRENWKRKEPQPGEPKNYARSALAAALRAPSDAYISNITYLYQRQGMEGDAGAFIRLAVRKMSAGEWTAYTAKGNYDRWRKERAQTADEELQRAVISRAAANLIGTVRPMSDIGVLHHALTDDELFIWGKQLSQARTVLTVIINKINKEREGRSAT